MRSTLAPILIAFLLALPGCKSETAAYTQAEERPRVRDDARWWELQGDKELGRGNLADDESFRAQQYTWAIRDFTRARDLYYDELFLAQRDAGSKPILTGRQEALDIEIERLTRQIEAIYKERPLPIVQPTPLSRKLTPDYPH